MMELKEDKGKLVDNTEHQDYGTTSADALIGDTGDDATLTLDEIYLIIGVGRAQWLYWTIIGAICYFEASNMVVISTILPLLRCEWDLDIYWETSIPLAGFLFSAIGSAISSKLSDMYGRKRILSYCIFFLFIFAVASSFSPNEVYFLVLRCLAGLFEGPIFTICIPYSVELGKSSRRETGAVFCVLCYNMSIFMGAVVAALILNTVGWRWFNVIMACPLVLSFLALRFILPESPRYLVVSGQKDQALVEIKKMAKINGVALPVFLDVVVHETPDLGSISALFRKEHRKETVLLSIMMFTNLLVVFAVIMFVPLALYSGFCGGRGEVPPHECVEAETESLVLLSIITFASVVAVFIGLASAVKLGRSISFKIFATSGFIASLFLFKCFSTMTTVVIFFIIKLCVTSFNIVSIIVLPEIYPTCYRNMGVGLVNGMGKVGIMVGSGVVYALYYYSPLAVVFLFSGTLLVSTLASWGWGKETKSVDITDVRTECQGEDSSVDR